MESKNNRFELYCGLVIALLSTCLALVDLVAGKYGDDEIIAINEKSAAYQWYQSKSIKETITEGEKELVKTLVESGVIMAAEVTSLKKLQDQLAKKESKYNKEKEEILKGSSQVKPENWVQADKNGNRGQIIGAQEWEAKADVLGRAGDVFDLSTGLYQITLVLGAVALVVDNEKMKRTFFWLMIVLGLVATGIGVKAYLIASLA